MEAGGMFSSVFSTSVSCFQLAVYFFSVVCVGRFLYLWSCNTVLVLLCGCTQSADCGDRIISLMYKIYYLTIFLIS
jgi:hypothetical protein